jgi:hypothetical protein
MAELRFGPQLGADLQLSGLLHAGLFGGATVSLAGGSYQGDEGSFATGEASLALFHLRERASLPGQQHSCLGLLPPLLCGLVSDERNAHPWAFELGLGLVLVGVRIGFDPAVALGGAEPEWGPEDEERRADPGSSR